MYIMAPQPIATAYPINTLHQPVCVCVYISIVARQRLSINVTAARNNRGILRRIVFYAVRVVSKESMRLVLPITSYSE
jgi:hypothetical protein